MINDLILEELTDKIAQRVMKIVNKHHGDLQNNVAHFRHEVKDLRQEFAMLKNSYVRAIGAFNDKHDSLPLALKDVKDSITAHSVGIQNVYNKFIELEKRQKEIEELLKSDRVIKLIESIPDEKLILKMFDRIDKHPLKRLQNSIDKIRNELEELVERFTY